MEKCGIKSYSTDKTSLKGQRISKSSGKCASLLFLKIFYTINILEKNPQKTNYLIRASFIHLALFRKFQVRQIFLLGFVGDNLTSRYDWGVFIASLPPLQCWLLLPGSWKYFLTALFLSFNCLSALLPLHFYCPHLSKLCHQQLQ